MGKFEKDAKTLLDAIGGKANVSAVSHCATRMRFVLADEKKANVKAIEAIPAVKVADCHFNAEQTEQQIKQANEQGAEIVVFPELGITGYTCQDLFTQQLLIEQAEQAVGSLLENTKTLDVIAVVGVPVAVDSILLNCAVVFQRGHILGIVPKTYLPNYSEFYEKRWFASTKTTCSCFAGTTAPPRMCC